MKSEDIIKIHLPDGNIYEVELRDGKSVMTDEDITSFRSFMGNADMVNINVRPNGSNGLMKEQVLILWGQTLKNSYITINRYSKP